MQGSVSGGLYVGSHRRRGAAYHYPRRASLSLPLVLVAATVMIAAIYLHGGVP